VLRLLIKDGVIIRELKIGVRESDGSYMPQQVIVSAGFDVRALKRLNEVQISGLALKIS
jgi:hypothetical protein